MRVLLGGLMLLLEVPGVLKASIGDRGHVLIYRICLFIVILVFAMIKANRFNLFPNILLICWGRGCVAMTVGLRACCMYLQVRLISRLFAIFTLINLRLSLASRDIAASVALGRIIMVFLKIHFIDLSGVVRAWSPLLIFFLEKLLLSLLLKLASGCLSSWVVGVVGKWIGQIRMINFIHFY